MYGNSWGLHFNSISNDFGWSSPWWWQQRVKIESDLFLDKFSSHLAQYCWVYGHTPEQKALRILSIYFMEITHFGPDWKPGFQFYGFNVFSSTSSS